MRPWWVLLAACGGSGSGGALDATVMIDGAPMELSEPCELTEGDEYFDAYAGTKSLAVEIKWRKAVIAAPGTYPTGGIIGDVFLFVLHPVDGEATISTASGSVTFSAYAAPEVVAGTFELTVPGHAVSANGTFECR